ncbi:hypothetical protein BT63DRAFT_475700 [Microthyrium microscopicum]|uniref:Hydrophobin n=1 Tax=Microthyrium microscopicum TaxID=703497 RepID=A0A6A6UPX9_9PEZI|nr:hypothetical protein BT63DRAFT_475700 [Microthyrium microscopicum]
MQFSAHTIWFAIGKTIVYALVARNTTSPTGHYIPPPGCPFGMGGPEGIYRDPPRPLAGPCIAKSPTPEACHVAALIRAMLTRLTNPGTDAVLDQAVSNGPRSHCLLNAVQPAQDCCDDRDRRSVNSGTRTICCIRGGDPNPSGPNDIGSAACCGNARSGPNSSQVCCYQGGARLATRIFAVMNIVSLVNKQSIRIAELILARMTNRSILLRDAVSDQAPSQDCCDDKFRHSALNDTETICCIRGGDPVDPFQPAFIGQVCCSGQPPVPGPEGRTYC